MQEVTKRALNSSLKNCETKVAQAGFQWANQRAGFQWNGVVLLGAVLLSLLFVGNLKAQTQNGSNGSTKQGFFAGIVYLQGFGVDTTKSSTNSATGYRIKYSNDITGIDATGGNHTLSPLLLLTSIRALFKENCEEGTTNFTQTGGQANSNGNYYFTRDYFVSFNEIKDATVIEFVDPIARTRFNNGKVVTHDSYCRRYFYGDLSSTRTPINLPDPDVTADSLSKPPVTSTESDALNGIGLQVGWRGEKWRASLTHFTGKGGANELANTVVMADYFFHEKFFAGGGLASMKLTNGSTSASATSPVVQVGYKENLTPNLFFNISLTKYISGISLSRSTNPAPIPTGAPLIRKTQTKDGDTVFIGGTVTRIDRSNQYNSLFSSVLDSRIEVTQVRSRDVEIQQVTTPAAQKIEAEIKAPVVVSISLLWRF